MTTTYSAPNSHDVYFDVPLADLDPPRWNPRQHFDADAIAELAADIDRHGLLHPLTVRLGPDGFRYEVIAGERRLRALTLLGRSSAPVRLVTADDEDAKVIALVENLQRVQLDALEEAEGYQQLVAAGMTQTAIAEAVKRSQPAIAKALSLLKLPEDVRARIRAGELSPTHGYALAPRFAGFPKLLSKLAELVVNDRLSARTLEDGEILSTYEGRLIDGKLLARLIPYSVDLTVCQACPFGAYRVVTSRWGSAQDYCLNPPHAAELQAARADADRIAREEASAARLASLAAIKERAPAATPEEAEDSPDASARPAAAFDLAPLRYYADYCAVGVSPPVGCSEACACRALGTENGREQIVCLDPERFRALQEDQRKADEKARKAETKTSQQRVVEALAGVTSIGDRELAVLVALAVRGTNRPAIERAAGDRYLPGVDVKDLLHAYPSKTAEKLTAFAADPQGAARFALEVCLLGELAERLDFVANAGLTRWYLGEDTPAAAEATS